ncbi:MAG: hypothetical protein AAGC55_26090, partial [Myxococcota bacterium]
MRDLDLTLHSLLSALREAGLTVGIGEIERLRRVFALKPPAERLSSIIAAVVVKRRDDRPHFERVFAAWLDNAEDVQQSYRPRPSPGPRPQPGPLPQPAPPEPPLDPEPPEPIRKPIVRRLRR